MIYLKLLTALAVPLFLGISFIKYLESNIKTSPALLISIGFGLGFGFLTQWMLLLSIAQIKFSQAAVGLPLILAAVILYVLSRRKKDTGHPALIKTKADVQKPGGWKIKVLDVLMTLYIAYIVVFVFFRGLSVPIVEWDAVSWIALKGKIFFFEKNIYQHQYLPNSAYPLHVPLSLAWTALNLGEWSEVLVKIIFPSYFLAYCILHYSVVSRYLNKIWAKASLALLVSAPFFNYHATIAYRDITLMFYFCGSILLTMLWHKTKNNAFLISSVLFLGFASFIKLEGVVYMLIGLMILCRTAFKDISGKNSGERTKFALMCLIPISIFLLYFTYKIFIGANHFSQNLELSALSVSARNFTSLVKLFFIELFLSPNWHITWLLLLLSALSFRKRQNTAELRIAAGAVFLFFATYLVLGAMTGLYDSLAGVSSSSVLPRVLLHIYPLAVICISLRSGTARSLK